MLMPRLQYPLNGFSPEMSLALSMQQQHINQLMNTAAAATGIVGDVDALLTPIHPRNDTAPRPEPGRERNLWRANEIIEMLTIMQELGAVELLSEKSMKSEMVFRKVEGIMNQRGFRKKTHVQIWTKWKFLKSTYTTSRRNLTIPKMLPKLIYEELHKMLHNSTVSVSGRSTSDCGNSATSLDGDNSNGGGSGTSNTNGYANESQLVISGVEGGYGNNSKKSAVGVESDEENGLAHPIFGFRLGLVKQEPTDTGYEHPKVAEKNSTAGIQFQTEIKQEFKDEDDTAVGSVTVAPQPPTEEQYQQPQQQQQQRHTAPEIMILSRRLARPSPVTTSTPKTTPSTSQPRSTNTTPTNPSPLPPLRIAPFAKVPACENETIVPTENLPPPPPLSMNPMPRPLRLSSAYSSGYTNATKNISVSTTTSSAVAAAYERKFQLNNTQTQSSASGGHLTPIRTYLRRQEHVLPDLETLPAPHEYRAPFYGFPDGPSTSQQAQQQQQLAVKKRRLREPIMATITQPKKLARISDTPAQSQAAIQFSDADNVADSGSTEKTKSTYLRSPQQRQDKQLYESVSGNKSTQQQEQDVGYGKMLEDLSMSLRQMQREVVNEFFKRQMRIAREEHEFQIRQDSLMMQAFTEQAQEFKLMANKLLGSALKLEIKQKKVERQGRKQTPNFAGTQASKKKTRYGTKNEHQNSNAKVMQNGAAKVSEEHSDPGRDMREVRLLMKDVHAELELSDDCDDERNQYDYEAGEYLQDNNGELEHNDSETMDAEDFQAEQQQQHEQQSEDGTDDDPIRIVGR